MRKVVVVLIALLAVALGFALSTLKTRVARSSDEYASRLAAASGRDVTIGSTGISLLPLPSVVARDIVISDKEAFGEEPLLELPAARVRPRVLPLLWGSVRIASVDLESPVLRAATQSAGKWNLGSWMFETEQGRRVVLPVRVIDGTLVVEQPYQQPPRKLTIEGVEATIEASDEDGTTRFSLAARPPGDGARLTAEGTAMPTGARTKGVALDLRYEIAGFDVESVSDWLPAFEESSVSGTVDLAGEAKGFAGGERTESAPAEKLDFTAKGRSGLTVKGVEAPMDVDLGLSWKEGRLRFDTGTLRWRGATCTPTGWIRPEAGNDMSLAIEVEGLDVGSLLADYAIEEQWRAPAVLSGSITIKGVPHRPIVRYEGSGEAFGMTSYKGLEVEVGAFKVSGLLAAGATRFTASVTSEGLRVGTVTLGPAFTIKYHRDTLRFHAGGPGLWTGKATFHARQEPGSEAKMEGGALVDDVDAALALENVLPNLHPRPDARLDALIQAGDDASGTWAVGRIGLHRGSFPGFSLARALLEPLAAKPGLAGFLHGDIVSAYKGTFRENVTEFEAVKFDFRTRAGGCHRGSVDIRLDGMAIEARGTVEENGEISLAGELRFEPRLRSVLLRAMPDLGRLLSDDGELYVPVRIHGRLEALDADVSPAFADLARAAIRGSPVKPLQRVQFGEPLPIDLPTLADQYGR